jgi:hypothetical protein
LICGGLAASAQVVTGAPAGRFAPPGGTGLPRLDAEPGAVSHCAKDATGEWVCAPFNSAEAVTADEIAALNRRIAALSAELEALANDVAELQRRTGGDAPPTPSTSSPQPVPPPVRAPLSDADQAEFERALGFMDILMRRFATMVEEMKRTDEPPAKQ